MSSTESPTKELRAPTKDVKRALFELDSLRADLSDVDARVHRCLAHCDELDRQLDTDPRRMAVHQMAEISASHARYVRRVRPQIVELAARLRFIFDQVETDELKGLVARALELAESASKE